MSYSEVTGCQRCARPILVQCQGFLFEENKKETLEIELVGLCTDICVVSNALLLKSFMPDNRIAVDPACCAGVTPKSHEAALLTMKMCQIAMEGQEQA